VGNDGITGVDFLGMLESSSAKGELIGRSHEKLPPLFILFPGGNPFMDKIELEYEFDVKGGCAEDEEGLYATVEVDPSSFESNIKGRLDISFSAEGEIMGGGVSSGYALKPSIRSIRTLRPGDGHFCPRSQDGSSLKSSMSAEVIVTSWMIIESSVTAVYMPLHRESLIWDEDEVFIIGTCCCYEDGSTFEDLWIGAPTRPYSPPGPPGPVIPPGPGELHIIPGVPYPAPPADPF
jgi:hypothetical protein